MKEKRIKILFVYSSLSSFIRRDLEILERHFNVKKMEIMTFLVPRRGRDPLVFLRLLKGILWADIVYSWFADLNAFFSVLFSIFLRKKSLVIVGGYDAAYLPEIGYGIFISRWSRVLARFTYKHADLILVVDPSLKRNILKNTGLKIEEKIRVVPTGYDANKWKIGNGIKENLVITVGAIINWSTLRLKGFETFVKAARYCPEANFVLIGRHSDDSIHYLKSIAFSNVDFPGFLSEKKLLRFYQRAKVYCQLSRYEGLPNSLCEAMLCGCIPVGTRYGGIPTAIGDTGFYVPYGDIKATAETIKKALTSNSEKGKAARARIKKLFPISKRERELKKYIYDLIMRPKSLNCE